MKTSVITAAMALALSLPVQAASNELNYNLVDFNETASVRVPNDTMNVVLEVQETGTSRQAVSNAVTRRLNAVLARAKAAPQLFEVESGNRSAYPQYSEYNSNGNRRVITGWTDTATVSISSRNFDALSKLVADSQNDASVDRLTFSVSPTKRTEAVNQASDTALRTFQQRAQHMSKTLGFSGYKIVRIQFNQSFDNADYGEGVGFAAAPQAAMMRARTKSAEIGQVSPGMQEIRQTIQVSVQMY